MMTDETDFDTVNREPIVFNMEWGKPYPWQLKKCKRMVLNYVRFLTHYNFFFYNFWFLIFVFG